MNKSVGVGLLVGLAIGLVGGAVIAKRRVQTATQMAPSTPAHTAPELRSEGGPSAPQPDPEIERLEKKVAELEAKLAAAPPAPVVASTEPAKAEAGRGEWRSKLDALFKEGASAYKSEAFLKLIGELKEHSKEAIAALAEKLLKSESPGERFLAAALMEDLDDPAAIAALSQALADDDDLLVRRMSSHAIAMIENEAGLSALRTAMAADSDWGVRLNSAYGVAKLGQADGMKMLEDAYGAASTPAEYRLGVLGALADVASPSSAPIFKKVLAESTDVTALYVTIEAVVKLKDSTFVPELNRIAADSRYSGNIRERARKAVETLAK